MNSLVEFLRARLDHDEHIAREAQEQTAPAWNSHFKQVIAPGSRYEIEFAEAATSEAAAHIALHDPARALAEIETKRAWLDDHTGIHRCDWGEHRGNDQLGWCTTLKRIAAPYASHPDYDESWRP